MFNPSREHLDLSGPWQIAFDPENVGVQRSWPGAGWPAANAQPIQVPEIWNIAYPDAEGVGFYRTAFTVPEPWSGQAILLHFEGVIYRCDVWVNGKYVGGHEGGYTPFELDVTSSVRYGLENSLVVRVAALSKSRDIDGMHLQHAPLSKQSWYYVYGGIWGRVTLESCPWVACQSVSIDPSLRREAAQLELGINNRGVECRPVEILMRVVDPGGKLACEQSSRVSIPPGVATFAYPLHIPRPLAWSCEQPQLYRLETQVVDADGQMDRSLTPFGMRDFTVQDGAFFLNGQPIQIRGVLLQPNFPINLINHPSREMMVREITLVKEAGFNLIRTHIQPSPPGYLDLADQSGILIYAESSLAWIRDNPRLLDHGRREIREMIGRDRNHPSIVFWGVYNENPSASAINGASLARFARTLDPTRVIVEDSGGSLAIDQDFGWIDRAAVTPAWEAQPQRIVDLHLYLGSPTPNSIYDWLRSLGTGVSSKVLAEEGFGSVPILAEFDRECRSYSGQIFVSELGCGGMADLDDQVAGFGGREDLLDARELKILRDSLHQGFQERELGWIFGSTQRMFQEAQELQAIGNTQQIEALLANPRVSGFIITQLNDVAWEFHAGLLDLWRNPKPAYYAAQRVNQPHVLVLKPLQASAVTGEKVQVDLTLVNRQPLHPGAVLQVTVYDPSRGETDCRPIPVPHHPGIHVLERIQVEIAGPGTHRVAARLLLEEKALAQAEETILALDPVEWEPLGLEVRSLGTQIPGLERAILADPITTRLPVYLAGLPATLTADEWEILLKAVETGAVAVIGALRPEDSTAIKALGEHGPSIQLHMGIGSWMGCYHWAPQSSLFSGLPAGGFVKTPYSRVIPKYVLSEMGGEVLAGSLRNTQSRLEAPRMLWYSDIEAVPYGKGLLLFSQYRAFEHLEDDPVAARLSYNLLAYAGQRSGSLTSMA